MEEWKEYKLAEVCENIYSGGTPSSMNASYWNGNLPWLSSGETSQRYIYYTEKCITKEGADNSSTRYAYKGSTVIASAGQGHTRGQASMLCIDTYVNQSVLVLKPNPLIINPHFLYFNLDGRYNELRQLSDGTSTRGSLSGKILKDLQIFLPPLNEQIKIASILKSLDDKIEVNRRINDNLEQQAQALFKSWFVDFEPFKNGEFVESELGMIPKGWSLKRIYEYVDVVYGAPYKSSLFNDGKEGLPLIRIRDLKTNNPQFYTPEVLPNTEYIEAGDIVAGMDAEFTPYIWQGERGVLNQRCCKFKRKYEGISNYFILFLIKPELEYVQSYKTGTTVSHLGKSDIDRFLFLTPPLDIVKAFSEIVNPMLNEVVNRSKESYRLSELRDILLPKLMSGEIKVLHTDLINEMLSKRIR